MPCASRLDSLVRRLMLTDIVIDTNVFAHADNPQEHRQRDAVELLEALLACDTLLVVDEGLDADEARNRSAIWREIGSVMTPNSFAFYFCQTLLSSGRVAEVSRKVDVAIARKINQCVRKPMDRTFLRVAYNTDERILISHDFEDFQVRKRRFLEQAISVLVVEAVAAVSML